MKSDSNLRTTGRFSDTEISYKLGSYVQQSRTNEEGWVSGVVMEFLDATTEPAPGGIDSSPSVVTNYSEAQDIGVAYNVFSRRPFFIDRPNAGIINPSEVEETLLDDAELRLAVTDEDMTLANKQQPKYALGQRVRLNREWQDLNQGRELFLRGCIYLPDRFVIMLNLLVKPDLRRPMGYSYLFSTCEGDRLLGYRGEVSESYLAPLF